MNREAAMLTIQDIDASLAGLRAIAKDPREPIPAGASTSSWTAATSVPGG